MTLNHHIKKQLPNKRKRSHPRLASAAKALLTKNGPQHVDGDYSPSQAEVACAFYGLLQCR
jgi:hypothetical protein